MLFGAVCYAATGWLTGAVVVLGFNFIVRRTGGIEASVLTNDSLALPAMRSDPQLPLRCAAASRYGEQVTSASRITGERPLRRDKEEVPSRVLSALS
jgi:hypothetical protein